MREKFGVVNSASVAVVALALALLLAAWLLVPAPLERDVPRDLPWQLPDYRLAKSSWEIEAGGRIHIELEHFFLEDISPAMVAWFYRQLPISTVQYKGTMYPLYHIFHPSEHGTISVLEAATDGSAGMGVGALIQRLEWFGPYDSSGRARVLELSSSGLVAVPRVAGMAMGEVRHSFRPVDGGTAYRVDTIIGSDLPVIGPLLNYYIRTRVFHPAMLEQWQRHQLEEVASLRFFLPQIYSQRSAGNHFVLE